jgi:glutamate dehydrogenase (NADP+)
MRAIIPWELHAFKKHKKCAEKALRLRLVFHTIGLKFRMNKEIAMNTYVQKVLDGLVERNAHEREFLQAAREILSSLSPVFTRHPEYEAAGLLDRFVEPDRVIMFRVPWVDDKGRVQVNRGYRVQFNDAIGPYKGGLRLHPSVNLSVIKFLGFEQVLKNSLTGLPIGGGKGGSDFDPKGKSDNEVMRFCQSFMTELYKYIGKDVDVPAGDIGVGAREIGFLYGQYKRITNLFEGVLTGKGLNYGGSLARKEATGYGLCYLTKAMMEHKGHTVAGKRVVISGSGNVAIYAAQKITQMGAVVVAMSDSNGYIVDEKGVDLSVVKRLKEVERGRIREYTERVSGSVYNDNFTGIWNIPCAIALPCATQNELDEYAAGILVKNGVIAVAEGANMPCTAEAADVLQAEHVLFAPGKAANAGGVAVSALEMSQNSLRMSWTFKDVDEKLENIMTGIFTAINTAALDYGAPDNYVVGANISGFQKVADAMLAQGAV